MPKYDNRNKNTNVMLEVIIADVKKPSHASQKNKQFKKTDRFVEKQETNKMTIEEYQFLVPLQ